MKDADKIGKQIRKKEENRLKNFIEQVKEKNGRGKLICVGLDIDPAKIPKSLMQGGDYLDAVPHLKEEAIIAFIKSIVMATGDLVCAFKVNRGFYDAMGLSGYRILHATVGFISEHYPDVPIIMDSKRGDIGNSNRKYYEADVQSLSGINAITLHPYTGEEDSLDVFLSEKDLGCIVLCRTSNRGAIDIQDTILENGDPLYLHVAKTVSGKWNKNGNCCLVVGATYTRELRAVRDVVGPDIPILVPGIGAQGGSLEDVLENNNGGLLIVNSSRGIIFASDGPGCIEISRKKVQEMNEIVARFLSRR